MRTDRFLQNAALAANSMLLVLALAAGSLRLFPALEVAGRAHPAVLHFPIVLVLMAVFWEISATGRSLPKLGDLLLGAAALSAVVAALSGLFLSKEGGFDPKTLDAHRWGGLATSLLAWGWLAFRQFFREKKAARWAMAAASVAALFWTGHHGANLTHGVNFLFQPLEKTVPAPAKTTTPTDSATVFEALVLPVFLEKCAACHNPSKQKGGLALTTAELLQKGGKHGPVIGPGSSAAVAEGGELLRRLHLPGADEARMPPAGRPQLTPSELRLIELWAKSPAPFAQKLADLPPELTDLFSQKKETGDPFNFPAASAATVGKLNGPCRSLRPVAAGEAGLAAAFFCEKAFSKSSLEELLAVKTQLVELNLTRMPVGDEALPTLAQFQNLRRLNLSETKLTGAALAPFLKNLKELRQLSLTGLPVAVADLSFLKELPKIERVFLWRTAVESPAGFEELARLFPKTVFEKGAAIADSGTPKLSAPQIQAPVEVFTSVARARIRPFPPGAEVRYTLDGSLPDSLRSPVAGADSLEIDRTCTLTARAFLPGWAASEAVSRQFFRAGARPDSAVLDRPTNATHKASGAASLSDLRVGDTEFAATEWLAFREGPMEARLFFKKPVRLSAVAFSSLLDINSYIVPPASIEIWGSDGRGQLFLLKKISPEQPKKMGAPPQKLAFTLRFEPREVAVLKIVARPVERLPIWHPGRGEKGWVFVDELFLE